MQTPDRARLALVIALAASGTGFAACRRNEGGTPVESPGGGAGASTGGAADGSSRDASRGLAVADRITLTTTDGWTLVGDYTTGASGSAVLLVHQLSSNRSEWGPLVARLRATSALAPSPLVTLAVDLRGHGESTRGPDGTTHWMSFGNDTARWSGLVTDVGAAVTYLRGRDPSLQRIVIVGSSIGSSAALRYAADDAMVLGVVMLSPGVSYRGLDTIEPLQRFAAREHAAALLLAGDGDTRSADSVRTLIARAASVDAGANVTSEIYSGTGAHGVAIGAAGVHPELWARIDGWIRAQIDPASAAALASASPADASTARGDASDPISPDGAAPANAVDGGGGSIGPDATLGSVSRPDASARSGDAGGRVTRGVGSRSRSSDAATPH